MTLKGISNKYDLNFWYQMQLPYFIYIKYFAIVRLEAKKFAILLKIQKTTIIQKLFNIPNFLLILLIQHSILPHKRVWLIIAVN